MPDPKDVPILFSAPMVRAILAGRKTATRRVLKPQPERDENGELMWGPGKYRKVGYSRMSPHYGEPHPDWLEGLRCNVGDRLWVRETWARNEDMPAGTPWGAVYKADPGHDYDVPNWKPSIHMPRWASRITLEVTALRVERLQDISRDDAIAEGIYWSEDTQGWTSGRVDDASDFHTQDPVRSYEGLWDAINGPTAWQSNP